MDNFGILSFFLLGLLGGYGHCAGMCNPFVLYVASRYSRPGANSFFSKFSPHLMYNLGRITTYTSLGLLLGVIGKISTNLTKLQGVTAITAGLFLLCYGLLGLFGMSLSKYLESFTFVKTILSTITKIHPNHPFWVGLILGFLPCGLVYSALAGALALSHPLAGGAAMALFGIGTSIAMMTLAFFGNYLANKRGLVHKLSMLFLSGMGLYFIYGAL